MLWLLTVFEAPWWMYLLVVILLGGFAMDGESKDKRKR